MLVAMTLMIFVMLILSQCFVQGLETFSGLKAIGDMQEQLRTASNLIRADLSLDHFEGKRRLSDSFLAGLTAPTPNAPRFREGFFVIGRGYPGKGSTMTQNQDGAADNVGLYRATDHWLHFSCKQRGNARDRFYSASDPTGKITGQLTDSLAVLSGNAAVSNDALFVDPNGSTFHSAWAEIAYVLLPTGTVLTPGTPPPVPSRPNAPTGLFALYRCQYAVIPDTSAINLRATGAVDGYPGIAHSPGLGVTGPHFLNPNDLAGGDRTFNPTVYFYPPPVNNSNPPVGATLVLSNVVSFEIDASTATAPGAPGGPFGALPGTNDVFDTANYGTSSAPSYCIKGIQVILRIYDPRSRQTRQVTVMQDM